MGVAQAVKQVAGDVVDTAKGAASASAKQIAKTPLDLLEEMLGQSPEGKKTPEAESPQPESNFPSPQGNPEDLKRRELADEKYRVERTEQLHKEIKARDQAYYEQKQAAEAEKKQAEEQAQSQKKFQIENLEKQKREDFALKAAQDAANAEKRVGAG